MNEEIMKSEEIIETTNELKKLEATNGYALAAVIGVGIIATAVITKRFVAPKIREVTEKIKREKIEKAVTDYANLNFDDEEDISDEE